MRPRFDPRDRDASSTRKVSHCSSICTHGRRDPCCAERGRPLAEAAAAVGSGYSPGRARTSAATASPATSWRSPTGCISAASSPVRVDGLMRAYDEGRIGSLDRYRGRSLDPFHVQVAERSLRERLGLDGVDAVTPDRADRDGGRAEVDFATERGPHRVRLERALGAPMRLTCHASNEEAPPYLANARDRARSATERLHHDCQRSIATPFPSSRPDACRARRSARCATRPPAQPPVGTVANALVGA